MMPGLRIARLGELGKTENDRIAGAQQVASVVERLLVGLRLPTRMFALQTGQQEVGDCRLQTDRPDEGHRTGSGHGGKQSRGLGRHGGRIDGGRRVRGRTVPQRLGPAGGGNQKSIVNQQAGRQADTLEHNQNAKRLHNLAHVGLLQELSGGGRLWSRNQEAVRRLIGAATGARAKRSGSARAADSLHRNTSSRARGERNRSECSQPELIKSRAGSRTDLRSRLDGPVVWIVTEQADAAITRSEARQ